MPSLLRSLGFRAPPRKLTYRRENDVFLEDDGTGWISSRTCKIARNYLARRGWFRTDGCAWANVACRAMTMGGSGLCSFGTLVLVDCGLGPRWADIFSDYGELEFLQGF